MTFQIENEGGTGITVSPTQLSNVLPARRLAAHGIKNPRAIEKLIRETAAATVKSAVANELERVIIKPPGQAEQIVNKLEVKLASDPIDASMDADVLIDATVSNIRANQEAVANAWEPWNVIIAGIIGYLYVTSMVLKDAADVLERLLNETEVQGSKRGPKTPHHKLVTRALLLKARWVPPDGSADDYGDRLRALEADGVEPNVGEVRRWLTEKALVGGKEVSGARRARAVLKRDRETGRERQERDDTDALEQSAASTALQRTKDDPLGVVVPNGDKQLPDGRWVALIDDDFVLMRLPLTEKEIRKKVLKSGGRA